MMWLSSACLIALGLFVGSAVPVKVQKPYLFAAALMGYGLPSWLAKWLAPVGITVEAVTAVLLLLQIWPRVAALVFVAQLLVYSGFVIYAMASGRSRISCGCFTFGADHGVGWTLLLRNGLAALLAAPPVLLNGRPEDLVGWTTAGISALFLTTALALVDSLGSLYDLVHS